MGGLGRSCVKAENFSCLFLLKIGTAIFAGAEEEKGRALTWNVYSLQSKCVLSPWPSNHEEV